MTHGAPASESAVLRAPGTLIWYADLPRRARGWCATKSYVSRGIGRHVCQWSVCDAARGATTRMVIKRSGIAYQRA
jgi:hypothetical protein